MLRSFPPPHYGNTTEQANVSSRLERYTRMCWNGQSQNTFVPGMSHKNITQVSEEIEKKVTKKLPQEFSGTESRILEALSKLVEFLLNRKIRTCTGAVPGTSRNNNPENREPSGDRFPYDHYPQVEFSVRPVGTSADSYRERTSHMVRGVQEEISYCSSGTS